jgi:amino acid transporter
VAPETADHSRPSLPRVVSRWEVVALSINDVVGSGVYLLPAAAAMLLGPASIWAVPVAGIAVLTIVLCFAEAGSLFDRPGGAYVYTRTAFGEFVGFEVGWMTWLARVTTNASISAGFAQALSGSVPEAGAGAGRAAAVALPLLALTAINIAGVKHGARTAVILVAGKLLPLVWLILLGLPAVRWERLQAETTPDASNLGPAALLLLFAYAGFENTGAPAGEFKQPRRDVPFALLLMIAGVTLIYTLIQVIAVGVVPGVADSPTPLADAGGLVAGQPGVWLLTVGALLSILGTNNNSVLAGSRYLFALAESGYLPRGLARISRRYKTPWVALTAQTALALPLALTGTFTGLAALSVVARLATYIGTAAAVPVLRRRIPAAARSVKLPGGPAIPIAALAICVWLLTATTAQNLIAGAAALSAGAIIFRGRRPPAAEGNEAEGG